VPDAGQDRPLILPRACEVAAQLAQASALTSRCRAFRIAWVVNVDAKAVALLVDLLQHPHRFLVERRDPAHRGERVHASRRGQREQVCHRRGVVVNIDLDLVACRQVHWRNSIARIAGSRHGGRRLPRRRFPRASTAAPSPPRFGRNHAIAMVIMTSTTWV